MSACSPAQSIKTGADGLPLCRQRRMLEGEELPEYMREALIARIKAHNERREVGAGATAVPPLIRCLTDDTCGPNADLEIMLLQTMMMTGAATSLRTPISTLWYAPTSHCLPLLSCTHCKPGPPRNLRVGGDCTRGAPSTLVG